MEKKLLYSAIVLFLIELTIFSADLGFLPISIFQSEEVKSNQPVIGHVERTRETVRKKSQNSIFWQSTNDKDTLNAFDSVLTLENSSAQLQLENDIQLNLNGNTLVVLEPIEKQGHKRFRIQFQKGNLRSRSKNQDFSMSANDWILEAGKGTDVSVTNLSDNDIQIEVSSGEAKIKNLQSPQKVTTIGSGSRVALDESSIQKSTKISQSLTWSTEETKKYDHVFPTLVTLNWKGDATNLRIVNPGKAPIDLPLEEGQNTLRRMFFSGTYFVTVENETSSSPTMILKVLPTDKLRHLTPLPRDRNDAESSLTFAWLKHPDVEKYQLQFSYTDDFSVINESFETKETQISVTLENTGLLYWRVLGLDSKGFTVPPFYVYPLYNVNDPLAPPKLKRAPERLPAKENKDGADASDSLFNHIWKWILPVANATEEDPTPPKNEIASNTKKSVIFSWYEVPEADYYVIEISVSRDFLNPILVKKIKTTEFSWTEFDFNTYYYRVAAGKNNGRMGLFSEPEEADLTLLASETASKELRPGLRLNIETIKKKEKKKQQQIAKKLEPEKEESEEKAVVRSIPTEVPKPLLRNEMKVTGSLFWAGGYIINSHSSEESVTANQTSFSAKRLGLGLTFPLHQSGHIALNSEYNQNSWEPDKKKLPFQKSLKQTHYFHSITWASQGSTSPWGIFYETIGLAKRSGSESLTLNETAIYGLVTTTQYTFFSSWNTRHILGLGYGDPYVVLHSDNYVFYNLNLWGENSGNTGLEFNIKYGQGGSSVNFINSQIMYRLGFQF